MAELESSGLLDRGLEALPDRESLRARRATFLGLTRPELAVLLAYAKMHCTRVVAASAVADDPYLDRVLFGYFPRSSASASRTRSAVIACAASSSRRRSQTVSSTSWA